MAVDIIARAMASKNGGGGGATVDAYTKEQTDTLLYNKADKSNVYTKENVDNKFSETNGNVQTNANEISDLKRNKANESEVYSKTESDSRFLNIDGTAKKAVADENGMNIAESFVNVNEQISVNRTTLGTQCKNLLKLYYPLGYKYTNAAGTVTWTFNNDYSVSMVANSRISSGVACQISEITLKKGTYIYSVEGYSTPNITHTQLYSLNADGSWTWLANLSAIENTITVTEETAYSFRAYRNSAVTVGVTETFYPMLRYVDITDDSYEPYKPSLQEQITALEARIVALENK